MNLIAIHDVISLWFLLGQAPAPTDGAIVFDDLYGTSEQREAAITLPWSEFVQTIETRCQKSPVTAIGFRSIDNEIAIGFIGEPRYASEAPGAAEPQKAKAYGMNWADGRPAQRLKRVFAIEIEKCEKCGGPAGAPARSHHCLY